MATSSTRTNASSDEEDIEMGKMETTDGSPDESPDGSPEASDEESTDELYDGDDSMIAELSWKDIKVYSGDGKKILLHNAIGKVKGRLLAIMGPSGAGKTSLLNLLAGRLQSTTGEGFRMINGHKYTKNDLKRLTGYVMQDDVLFPYLTVHETLSYSAYLRLPSKMKKAEKLDRVEELIIRLGLESCRNTQVGDSIKKGISGGERKRLCIAIELLTRPRVLFLDEPTSGLDSVTAMTVIRILKELARKEKTTVVCTVHQPSTKLFNLFDDLMILKSGCIVYHGQTNKVLEYYEEAGFPCPNHTNPGDHVLDVITPTSFTPDGIKVAEDNAAALSLLYRPDSSIAKPKKGKVKMPSPPKAPWWSQFLYLTQRSFRNSLRAHLEIFAQFMQTIVLAFLVGGVFWHIGNTQTSISKRNAVLFFVVINQGIFNALILINSFPSERVIVLRERAAGMYSVSAYYLAKSFAETTIQIIFPIIFGCIVYFMIGLQHDAGKFFIFLLFLELGAMTATSLALAVSTISRTVSLSVTLLPFVLEICRLFGGFFLPPALLPDYFSWIDALSFPKYTYMALAHNENSGLVLTCTTAQLSSNGTCPITSGEQVISSLGLDKISIIGCGCVLLSMIIFYRTVAYCALRWDLLWNKLTTGNVKRVLRKCGILSKKRIN